MTAHDDDLDLDIDLNDPDVLADLSALRDRAAENLDGATVLNVAALVAAAESGPVIFLAINPSLLVAVLDDYARLRQENPQ